MPERTALELKMIHLLLENRAALQKTLNESTLEALKELGISQEEWQGIVQNLPPEEQNRAIDRGTKKYVRKAAASKPKPIVSAKDKVNQGGRLSSDEELEVLTAVLGEDFRL